MTSYTEDLSGRTALVTGATAGIGEAVALALGSAGADVIVSGRDAGRGGRVVDAIVAGGGSARFAAAELSDLDSLQRLVDGAGDVDVLVNNAGIAVWGDTPGFAMGDVDAMLAVNVRAPFFLVRALVGAMIEKREGSIINLSSMTAHAGEAGSALYSATKASLDAMTRSWAAELGPHGVRVNSVAPGPTYSSAAPREAYEAFIPSLPLGRVAEPIEIAQLVLFLASARAGYVTGATFAVDGGRTAI